MSTATANPDIHSLLEFLPKAPPLPKPQGKIVRVADTAGFVTALEGLEDGTTILLADGVYTPPVDLTVERHGIVIRGESGDREKAILDLEGKRADILRLKGGCQFTLADLTMRNSELYGLRIYGDSAVKDTRIHNVKFHNIWTRGLKGTGPRRRDDNGDDLYPEEEAMRRRPFNGLVQYCLFQCDTPKPWPGYWEPDYIAGLDMMGLRQWTFADNLFVGVRGQNGGGRGAIFVWIYSEDVVAERNLFVNCDRSISFGNPSGPLPEMTRGIVRENVIVAGLNKGIEMCGTRESVVHHNTICKTADQYPALQFAKGAGGCLAHHNLIHGQIEEAEGLRQEDNLTGELEGIFADPLAGDLRLTEKGRKDVPGDVGASWLR